MISTRAGRFPWRLTINDTSATSDIVHRMFTSNGTSVSEELPPLVYFDNLDIPKPKRKKTRKPSWIEKQQKRRGWR